MPANGERVYEQPAAGATQAALAPLAANLRAGIYKEKFLNCTTWWSKIWGVAYLFERNNF